MTVFSNLNLKTKLVTSFAAIALITCVVTAIAWWNLSVLRGKLSDVANKHLPGVRSLSEIRLSTETFKMVRRTVRDPNLDLNDYRLMLGRIAKAQESYESAMKTFAALEMNRRKAALWNDFQATWIDWRKSNDEYFHVAGDFAKILEARVSAAVPNPGDLLNRSLDALAAASGAEIEIKKLVQAWKDILLRGDNAEDYSKYSAELEACDRRIRANLDVLKTIAPEIGLEQTSVTNAESLYVSLVGKYRAALQELKTRDPENLRKLDKQLHGVDRPVTTAFDGLPVSVESHSETDSRTDFGTPPDLTGEVHSLGRKGDGRLG